MSSPIPIPRRIDDYRIVRLIGEGGMGRVLLAEDPVTEKHVALKHIHPNLLRVSNYRQRFEREMEIMTDLSHPNLMPLLARGIVGEIPYYVMPYIDGISIRDYLRQYGAFSPEQTLHILNGICAALTYMHSHSVYHRDIKPHNILLDRQGTPYLTDFGIAADLNANTKLTNTIQRAGLGTDGYVAPELRGGAFASPRTDVYSLGMTAYEMMARRSLFEVLSEDVSNPMAPIPEPLQFVISRAIEQTPRARYQQVSQFLLDFRSVVEFEHDNLTNTPLEIHPNAVEAPSKTNTKLTPLLGTTAFPDRRRENHIVAISVTIVGVVLVFTIYLVASGRIDRLDVGNPSPPAPATAVAAVQTEPVTEAPSETPTVTVTTQPPPDVTRTFEAAFFQALTATATRELAARSEATQRANTTATAAAATNEARIAASFSTQAPRATSTPPPTEGTPTRTPLPSPTENGIPFEGQVLFLQQDASLYDRVNGSAQLTLEAGTRVRITTDGLGKTFFDFGEQRFFVVSVGGTTGWVEASALAASDATTAEVPIVSNPAQVATAVTLPQGDRTPARSIQPTVTPSDNLGVGVLARTNREVYAVNLPGSNVGVDLVPSGAFVSIFDGPRESNGETWWRVRTPDNSDGWIEASALEP